MKFLLLIAAAVALTSSLPQNLVHKAVTRLKPRIINGNESAPNFLPYQVLIEIYPRSGGVWCAGSLITRNYVLTSASCVYVKGSMAYVTLGVHNILGNENTRIKLASTSFKIHENYQYGNFSYDIALIKLPETVPLTKAIRPVQLPKRIDVNNTYAGVTARVSGWGKAANADDRISDVLKYVDVEVITNSLCAKTFLVVTDSIICTSGLSNTGACYNDGGDPLVVDGVQIGISTFISKGCPLGKPSGYTRITKFLDWIEANSDIIIA